VALNHRLEPGEHSLCHACGLPLSPTDRQLPSYELGVSCRHCLERYSDADRTRFRQRQQQMELASMGDVPADADDRVRVHLTSPAG
jgi:UPF0176 protein